MTNLKLFIQPDILQRIGARRLGILLRPFAAELQAINFPMPPPDEPEENHYFHTLAAALTRADALPHSVRSALLTLETAAAPESNAHLEDAIKRRLPNVSLPPNFILDRALEVWFVAPEELAPFTPPAAPPSSIQYPVSSIQPDAPRSDDFSRLARLSPVDYERVRKTEALRLNLRVRVLDSAVANCRAELRVQHEVQDFPDLDPWPEPADGAQLLAELSALFSRRLFLPPGAADAMALWVHLPHVLEAFHIVPRLSLYSLEPGCGKTTALDILTLLVPRPLRTESVSLPVIYRLVDKRRVTLLLDELDTYLPQSDKHRGLLNAGHKRGARTYRCAEGGDIIRGFNAFAAAVLASLGPLASTLRDRSIAILMVKAKPGQIAEPFDPLHTELETTLGRKLARWAKDNLEPLKACQPTMPPGVYNRLADNWRPLFAVAQLAGGDWPARALAAFNHIVSSSSSSSFSSSSSVLQLSTVNYQLLADIRVIFAESGAQRLFSSAIVDSLRALPDRPWSGTNNGDKPLTVVNLGRRLNALGIASRNLRIGDEQAKGYDLADLTPAFARLLDK